MKRLMLILISTAQFALASPVLVPEIPKDNPDFASIMSVLDWLKAIVHLPQVDFHGITGTIGVASVDNPVGKNSIDVFLYVNDRVWVPHTLFSVYDNSYGLSRRPDGIHLTFVGFRVDTALDRPALVQSDLRMTNPSGQLLANMEYTETTKQAQTPDYLETHPVLYPAKALAHKPSTHLRAAQHLGGVPSMISPERPGTPEYDYLVSSMNLMRQPDPGYYYIPFEFAGSSGELGLVWADRGKTTFMIAHIGSRYFRIDFNKRLSRFWTTFTREPGASAPGIYLTSRGFRVDWWTGEIYSVISRMRIADLQGRSVARIAYSETVEKVTSPNADMTWMELIQDFGR